MSRLRTLGILPVVLVIGLITAVALVVVAPSQHLVFYVSLAGLCAGSIASMATARRLSWIGVWFVCASLGVVVLTAV